MWPKRLGYRLILVTATAVIGLLAAGVSLASSQSSSTPVPGWERVLRAQHSYLAAHRPSPSHAGPKAAQKELARLHRAARALQHSQPPLTAGISRASHPFGPFSHCTFAAYSSYVSPPVGTDRAQTILYAGYIHPPGCGFSPRGGVYEFRSAGNSMSAIGMFAAPTASPLNITTVRGQLVGLKSDAGQRYIFDLSTRSFQR
jgi:hypothetical protein